jgi:hypothetical protein
MTELPLNSGSAKQREMYALADALLCGAITAAGAKRLDELLRNDLEARRHYVEFMYDSASFCHWSSTVPAGDEGPADEGEAGCRDDSWSAAFDDEAFDCPADAVPGSSPLHHFLADAQDAVPARGLPGASYGRPIFQGLPQSVLFCYTVVALLLGVGLLAAGKWRQDENSQVATVIAIPSSSALPPLRTGTPVNPSTAGAVEDVLMPPPVENAASPGIMIVGKITGMSNCRWAHPCVATRVGDPVARGRRYPITAGLLEITYNTGVKVTIEGPAIFAASARNAGSLYVGKLTARADKLDRAALVAGERARGRPLPSPAFPAYRVHTPTAVISDDGDQAALFGVEIDRSRATFTRVFQGVVSVGAAGFSMVYCIPAGTCVWTGAGANHDGLLLLRPDPNPNPSTFLTEIPKLPPVCLTQPAANESGGSVHGGG